MQTSSIYKTHDIQKAFILNQIVTIISSAKGNEKMYTASFRIFS